jgi:HSP20 family protein
MTDRKQSFLERLTGIHKLDDDEFAEEERREREGGGPPLKPWNPAVYNEGSYEERDEERYKEVPRKHAQREDEPATEEAEDDDEEEAGLAIDMYESDNELIIQSMVAGITPENLHISITRDSVTLSGRRIAPQGISDEHYVTRELYWGTFSRVIDLPCEIDTDSAEAVEKYGLLIIRLPKLDTERTQELRVKSI